MKKHSEGGVAGASARAAITSVITDGADAAVPLDPPTGDASAAAETSADKPSPEPLRETRRASRPAAGEA